jgi:uncharacterized protein YggE
MEYFHITNRVELVALAAAIAILAVAAVNTRIDHIFTNVNAQTDMTNNTLFVTGSATNETKPDKVTVSLGVETTNSTAQAALTANSYLMNKVLDALKAAGVQENETSTSTFSITPNYNYSSNTNQGRLIGFTVTNSIQIESSNMESVSKWIDVAVSAGANNVNNIYFSLSDKKLDNMKNSLLKDAIDNAKTKADIAASAAGLKVVGVKSISVVEVSSPPPVPIYRAQEFAGGAAPSPTPILSGQQDVSASVDIIYLIG